MALEKIKEQEEQLKQIMIYAGRPGLWSDWQNMYIRSNLESTCHCLLAACLLLSQHTQTTKTHVSSLAHASFLSSPVHYAATAARDYLIRFELPSKSSFWSLILDPPCCSLLFLFLASSAIICGADFSTFGDGSTSIRRREDSISRLNFVIACIFRHSLVSFYQRNALSR